MGAWYAQTQLAIDSAANWQEQNKNEHIKFHFTGQSSGDTVYGWLDLDGANRSLSAVR